MSQLATQFALSPKAAFSIPPDQPAVTPTPKFFGTRAQARKIIDRLTFGFTSYELSLLMQHGIDGYLRYHLYPEQIADTQLDAFLVANYPTLTMTPQNLSLQTSSSDVSNQLIRARLMRAIFSRRQLFERVVEMWTDHFNIWIRDEIVNFLKTADDRTVIRANALGTFSNLLSASAHSPAMLIYLNNDTNKVGRPNENYARELMELHTLGVDGGYTQADVQQVAKCFTGWTYFGSSSGATAYTFQFKSTDHDATQKTVLGNIIPARAGASGQQDGEDVLNILANHPSTRQYIARKIVRHFWGHSPSQALVDSTANIHASTGGNLRAMVEYVLRQTIAGPTPPKFKRPMHLLVSLLRATNARVTAPNNVQTPLTEAGHLPFDWSPPDGYPDTLEAWTGLLLARWNFGARLMNNDWFNSTTQLGITVDTAPLIGTAVTAPAVTQKINDAMFNGTLGSTERTQLENYLLPNNPSSTKVREAIGLAGGLPSFQWY
ncbi:MAG: DUF1800 domain-containing protein [Phycisphaerales bacterium]|nr:DUF1800 domain-containing protein [Phycisphaerales bacterium]